MLKLNDSITKTRSIIIFKHHNEHILNLIIYIRIYLNGAFFLHAQTLNSERILIYFYDFAVGEKCVSVLSYFALSPFCEQSNLHENRTISTLTDSVKSL